MVILTRRVSFNPGDDTFKPINGDFQGPLSGNSLDRSHGTGWYGTDATIRIDLPVISTVKYVHMAVRRTQVTGAHGWIRLRDINGNPVGSDLWLTAPSGAFGTPDWGHAGFIVDRPNVA